jgi:hypothetical protein
VRKEIASPSKKKKVKSNDTANAETVLAEETKNRDDDSEKTLEVEPSSKEEKDEVKM